MMMLNVLKIIILIAIIRTSFCVSFNGNGCGNGIAGDFDIDLDLFQGTGINFQQRSFHLHVPDNYDPNVKTKIILMLHGGLGDWTSMAFQSDILNYSDDFGYLVAFGRGYQAGIGRTWNAGGCCGRSRNDNIDDMLYLDTLIEYMDENYCIDEKNIFSSGFSNGSMMQFRLVCERDYINSVGIVDGGFQNADVSSCLTDCNPPNDIQAECYSDSLAFGCDDPHQLLDTYFSCDNQPMDVPIIVFWGLLDANAPYNGGAGSASLDSHVDPPVEVSVDYFVEKYNCNLNPIVSFSNTSNNDVAICNSYIGCSADITVCTAQNNAHNWPGGNTLPIGDQTTTENIIATVHLLDFFEENIFVEAPVVTVTTNPVPTSSSNTVPTSSSNSVPTSSSNSVPTSSSNSVPTSSSNSVPTSSSNSVPTSSSNSVPVVTVTTNPVPTSSSNSVPTSSSNQIPSNNPSPSTPTTNTQPTSTFNTQPGISAQPNPSFNNEPNSSTRTSLPNEGSESEDTTINDDNNVYDDNQEESSSNVLYNSAIYIIFLVIYIIY